MGFSFTASMDYYNRIFIVILKDGTAKHQNTSTKFQINSKFEISMTETT